MRLAKSQAHQPFPGFFKPGFLLSNQRCKSLFQSVCLDSNRALSPFWQIHSASALFERRFFPADSGIFLKKESQRFGRRFVGPDGLRKRRPFSFQKGRWCQRQFFVGRSMIALALFFCTREELYEHQRGRKEPLPQRSSDRPCPRRISDGQEKEAQK